MTAASSAITTRMLADPLRAQGEFDGHYCRPFQWALDRECAVDTTHPIVQSLQPASHSEHRPTYAVVDHPNVEASVVADHFDVRVARAAVLRHVGEQFFHAEVGDLLDRGRRWCRYVDPQGRGARASSDERGQRRLQTKVQSRWVDPSRDVAQLDERLLGL